MGLPNAEVLSIIPALGDGLAPDDHAAELALLEEYADLFSTGPHDFGLLKGTQHQLDLEDARPFCAQPYCKSKVEEAQVSIELKQLLDAGLLQPSKSPWVSPLLLLKKKDGGHRVIMDYRNSTLLQRRIVTPSRGLTILYAFSADLDIYWQWISRADIGRTISRQKIKKSVRSSPVKGSSNPLGCHRGYETLRLPSNGQWTTYLEI